MILLDQEMNFKKKSDRKNIFFLNKKYFEKNIPKIFSNFSIFSLIFFKNQFFRKNVFFDFFQNIFGIFFFKIFFVQKKNIFFRSDFFKSSSPDRGESFQSDSDKIPTV